MIRRMEARDKAAVLGLIRATEFFTAAGVGDDRVIYAKYFR